MTHTIEDNVRTIDQEQMPTFAHSRPFTGGVGSANVSSHAAMRDMAAELPRLGSGLAHEMPSPAPGTHQPSGFMVSAQKFKLTDL